MLNVLLGPATWTPCFSPITFTSSSLGPRVHRKGNKNFLITWKRDAAIKINNTMQTRACNLFCSIAEKWVEKRCCAFYHSCSNLSYIKSACCRVRKVVAERREYFYFLQQNLSMLRVLAAKGIVSRGDWFKESQRTSKLTWPCTILCFSFTNCDWIN